MNERFRGIVLIAVVTAVVLILAGSTGLLSFAADLLFFRETGYQAVFLKTFRANALAALVFGCTAFLVLYANVRIATRARLPQAASPSLRDLLPFLRVVDTDRLIRWAGLGLSLFAALIALSLGTQFGLQALLALAPVHAGVADPLFGKDIAFYLFRYPVIDAINEGLQSLFVLALLMVAAIYVLRGALQISGRSFSVAPAARRHLGILAAIILLSLAVGLFLDRFGLLFSEHSILYGASYADVNARLPALTALAVLTAAGALVVAVTAFGRNIVIPIATLALLAGLAFLGLKVWPGTVQSIKVAPNELALERPYIVNHIAMTRYAYGLDKIDVQPFKVRDALTMSDLQKDLPTLRNIRLWDEDPLLKTYSQLQQIRTYYRFYDVDNDRYTVDGKYMQVMLSPRELSYADLPGKTWINERLVFTHGFGLALGPVSGITREGLPQFFIKDIPPVTTDGLKVTRPEIYYGESPNEYVIVKTKQQEFGYPTTDKNIYTTYAGTGGVRLTALRRLLYAAYFGDFKIVLSRYLTPQSRILYRRDIRERVESIAPFLSYDDDPYMVVGDDGRLFWIIDAYTHSDLMPYAKPVRPGLNYIRNPVKVVVDAYNGDVSFYLVDPDDVMARAYAAVFPGLFKPLAQMRPDLRRHIRYPRTMLAIQAHMYTAFHMQDPEVFYNKEDLWEVPSAGDRDMDPYYLITKLPDGKSEEYVLLQPFTPAKRDNLAAWMAARCDGDQYGKVVVYTFSRDRLIFGPRQIDARIDQDAYISQQLTLWGQHGSQVIRGSLLIIPIEHSLLYVQPLFLVATDQVGLPELRRVIVAYGNNVVMDNTLEAALQRLLSGNPSANPPTLETGAQPAPQQTGGTAAARALDHLRKARQALRDEDWAGFGRELKAAEDALKSSAR